MRHSMTKRLPTGAGYPSRRHGTHFISTAALAALLVLLAAACYEPRGQAVTYRNEMALEITVTSDGHFLVTLLRGESKVRYTREDLLPDRIQAYDSRGNLVFDRTYTWEDLKANEFVVVIR